MDEIILNQLLSFSGDTVSVLEVIPSGVTATPGGTPTAAFEDVLAGLLVTQTAVTAELASIPAALDLDPTLGLPPTGLTETPVDATDVNDPLVNFFNVTPSGVPLPSQRVQVSTTPTPETENPNAPTTPNTQETIPTRLEPITLEQIRVRERSTVATTTTNVNAPPLPPVIALPNPDGTILARPPEPDDVRSRIPEIGAVAPSVTGLTPDLFADPRVVQEAQERFLNSQANPKPVQTPFELPSVPSVSIPATDKPVTLPPVGDANPIRIPVPVTNPIHRVEPTTVVPAQPVVNAVTPLPVQPVVGVPQNNVVVSPTATNPTANASANVERLSKQLPNPATISRVTARGDATIPVEFRFNPPVAAPKVPQTNIVPAAVASTGPTTPGVFIPGVEVRGALPTIPSLTPTVAQFPAKTLVAVQTERRTEIAFEETSISPTPITSGEPLRTFAATTISTGEAVQTRSVIQQTADVLIREATLTQTPGESEFRLRLHPVDLGEIRVHLRSTAEGLTAQLSVATESVRQMIESQLPDLRQRLADSGVTVNGFNVSTDSGSNRGQSGSPFFESPRESEPNARQLLASRAPKSRAASATMGLDVTA